MKNDILIPGIVAVAIHGLVLSVPLSKTNPRLHIYEPISISIVCSKEAVYAVSPVKASAKKPPSETRRHVPDRQRVISNHNKLVKESALDRIPKDQGKKIDTSPPVKTASTAGHTPIKEQRGTWLPQENRVAKASIVYARPKYKANPLPHYPEVAKRRGYEGKILLRVKVLESGKAGEIEIEESSGFEVLDLAALRSVKGWTFVPGTINGKRMEQWIRVPIRFVLK